MRQPWICVAVVAGLLSADGLAARRSTAQDPQRPVFRSTAAAVPVDVAVRNRAGRPVTGLTIDDFELLDNGVPQQIDTISYGKLPIDVTIGLDVSHSVTGTMLDRLRRAVARTAAASSSPEAALGTKPTAPALMQSRTVRRSQ